MGHKTDASCVLYLSQGGRLVVSMAWLERDAEETGQGRPAAKKGRRGSRRRPPKEAVWVYCNTTAYDMTDRVELERLPRCTAPVGLRGNVQSTEKVPSTSRTQISRPTVGSTLPQSPFDGENRSRVNSKPQDLASSPQRRLGPIRQGPDLPLFLQSLPN
ncbi:hypothetical protein B0T17DRAFT_603657 [Bombardia bombarda]|uniref:Uncharacterized protein n=1 Tax=Bombardia bombarda TaxID=252184 RepID=A0AA39U2J1_9PEZI|nr:hypothetical protein B0T17DRAFT_603657 [Bombardia bombarda]